MTFTITHISGSMERDPAPAAIDALIDELATADAEHPDVAVSDESGWTLSAFRSGLLIWENVEEGEPRHRRGVDREEISRLFHQLAEGDVATVESGPWNPGYGGG